jgi:hypothetical protein
LADLLSLIPFVGDISGPVFWVCASVYLWKIGCGFVNAKRLATGAISTIAEMIPAIQAFPMTLAGIIIVIVMVRTEDKLGMSKTISAMNGHASRPLNQDGIRLPAQAMQPANVDGVRAPQN